MYEEFYGFREKPFSIVPDPSFLYMSARHQTALTYLEYGLMDGIGFILLTGEIGTGKTTLIKRLLMQIGRDHEVAVIFNTNVSAKQMLELILNELELEVPERDKADYLDALNEFLVNKHGSGQKVLLIVDEAQNLSQEALEEIRMLSNLQTDKEALLQILLVGQPGLRARLQHPSLAQLSQRIAVSCHLGPLSPEDSSAYIKHRLKVAGAKNEQLFSEEAMGRIFHYSGGIPRAINILCDAALVYGYADQLTSIDGEIIEHVVRDKQEFGLFAPLTAGEEAHIQGEEPQGNGSLLNRLERLEQRVNQLFAMVDWQVQEHERRTESYKDTLVHRLERMLSEERTRTDRLLVKYNLLRKTLHLSKLGPAKGKVRPVKEETRDVPKEDKSAGTKDRRRAWGRQKRLGDQWFTP